MPDRGRPLHAPSPPIRPRRRHPARSARAAAIGMSIASAAGLTAFFDRTGASAGAAVSAAKVVTGGGPTTTTSTTEPPPAATATSIAARTTTTTQPTTTTARTQPHVVDGGVYANRWGDVQVEVRFGADGAIQSADAIQTPDSHGQSIEINDQAVPILDSEAVSAQSAQIHTVSGATYTSDSYRSSLQSAIDAARHAGLTTLT